MPQRRFVRTALAAACLAGGLALLPAPRAQADTIWLQSGTGKPIALQNVKVQGAQDENLTFTTAAGVSNTKPLEHIPLIKMDDEPTFSAAEEAFSKGDWA